MSSSILLATDCYKLNHQVQYKPGTNKVYSYLCPRSDKYFDRCVFFGLQYYLKEYLAQEITHDDAHQFVDACQRITGSCPDQMIENVFRLADLGYWPLEIKAIPEGTVIPVKNAVLTMTNTLPEFFWCVGFVESLLLKVWYPMTVATTSMAYRQVVDRLFDETGEGLRDFAVHDFGYRSDSSEEGAAISGAAHLLSFRGSDTIPAFPFIQEYYDSETLLYESPMLSVPATEHSVMCSYGPEGEMEAFERMLDLYPTGIVSIVSDTYSIWDVCTKILPALKDRILARDGKVVIRPDSGFPPDIICGRDGSPGSLEEYKGVLRLLDEEFGHTINSKGYKELNPKIGLIYGDGMYLDRYKETLIRMKTMGYAANNLVIGCGGILRQGTRDTLGMALKATYVEQDGKPVEIYKAPVTDTKKHSHRGLMAVYNPVHAPIFTVDRVTAEAEKKGILQTVFKDGVVTKDWTWNEVKANYEASR